MLLLSAHLHLDFWTVLVCKNEPKRTTDNWKSLQQWEVSGEQAADFDTLPVINYEAPESTVGR